MHRIASRRTCFGRIAPRESKANDRTDSTPKDRGNVFGNMMRSPKCPAHVKKEWGVLKSLGTKDVNRCEFVAQVIDAVNKGKLFDNDFFDKIKIKYTETVEHTELDRTKQGWKSYEWVAKEEGRIITDELLKLKRLDDRRNLKLPSDSTLAFPYDREIWWEETLFEKISSHSQKLESVKSNDNTDATSEYANAFNGIFRRNSETSRSQGPRPEAPGIAKQNSKDEIDMDAVAKDDDVAAARKNVQKRHSEWDRKLRECNGILRRSKASQLSKDTPLELEFKRVVENTIRVDVDLLRFDTSQQEND